MVVGVFGGQEEQEDRFTTSASHEFGERGDTAIEVYRSASRDLQLHRDCQVGFLSGL